MLTRAERRRGIFAGVASMLVIGLFVALPTLGLLVAARSGVAGNLFDPYTLSILRFTLVQAALSTILSLVLAVPVALSLARQTRFPGRVWLVRLMAVPMGLPVLIGALGLIGIFGRQGLLNGALATFGLQQPVSIYGLTGILIGHVFFNLPLAVRLMLAALERLPQEYWRLSASLGMRSWSIFRFIEAPALAKVVPGAAGLVFMLCATSFTLVLVLGGGPAATTLEVAIYQSLRFDFDPPRAVALSMLQITLTALVLWVLSRLQPDRAAAAGEGRRWKRFDGDSLGALISDGLIILCAALFLLMPLGMIVMSGVKADLWRLVSSPAFHAAARTSLTIAVMASVTAMLLAGGIIAARTAIIDRRNRPAALALFSGSLAGLSSLVLLVPPVVLGTGWFLLIRQFGPVAAAAPVLIAAINALMALPFVMRILEPALDIHRARTQRLAASLALTGWTRLRLVDWPVLRRPVFMAVSFAMALSLGDLGAVALFGSNELTTLPWLVYSRLGSYRTQDADGLALILAAICLVLTMIGTIGHKERT